MNILSRNAPVKNVLDQMRTMLEKAGSISRMSTIEIPTSTVDGIDIVRNQAGMNDIVVTDSAPFAFEFLQAGGEATNCFGEVFAREDIDVSVRRFHACKELKRQGVNPYKSRPYRTADRERLFETLMRLIHVVCSATPKEVPVDFCLRPLPRSNVSLLPLSDFEKGPNMRVFVDGDSCPRLSAILEICGSAHVPIVYVSNNETENVARTMQRSVPWLEFVDGNLPDPSIEKVPMEKNATDQYIVQHISSGDIVLTDDTGLMAVCMNKGALAIDYRGRALGRPQGCGMLGKADVKVMRASISTGRKKKFRANAFRRTLLKAVG